MNTLRTLAVCLLAGFAMVGCNSGFKDIKIDTETNPKVDFAGYDSYAWAAAAAISSRPGVCSRVPSASIRSPISKTCSRATSGVTRRLNMSTGLSRRSRWIFSRSPKPLVTNKAIGGPERSITALVETVVP